MPRVCFSHRSTQIPYVTSLIDALHANGVECFHQSDIELSGPHWQSQWLQAAESSEVIVCVLTCDYLGSSPCCEEFAVAQGEKRAVVVYLDKLGDLTAVATNEFNGPVKMHCKAGKQGLKPAVTGVVAELMTIIGSTQKQAAPAIATKASKSLAPGRLANGDNAVVRLGSDNAFPGYIGTDKFYCGWRKAIPGTDGKCGPQAGAQCPSCERFTATHLGTALRNDEAAAVRVGNDVDFPGYKGSDKFYCGRVAKLAGSDGECGPSSGPQCASCARFTKAWGPHLLCIVDM